MNVTPILDTLAHSISTSAESIFLPRHCPICRATVSERGRGWCDACESGMRVFNRPLCPVCRRFLDGDSTACSNAHDEANPSLVHALGSFDGAFGTLVHALKYDGYRQLAIPLGTLLAERVDSMSIDRVVAVPTAKAKRRARGFGHAEELAQSCARRLDLPVQEKTLTFVRKVGDQTRLSAPQRHANMHEALAVPAGSAVAGRSILIVDDVLTTGATISEAARALRAAGASSIIGAVVAINLSSQI